VTGPQPATPYSDVGDWLAGEALVAIAAAIDAAKLTRPKHIYTIHGSGTIVQDPCEGLLWARISNVYPTNGDGKALAEARIDFSIPAWAITVDAGIIWCREVVDEEGSAVDFEYETAIATRDSNYRMTLLDGMSNYFPAAVKPCALGLWLSPWTPIGPDGAWSGGVIAATVITPGLSVTGL
jgi:hypothetical protein